MSLGKAAYGWESGSLTLYSEYPGTNLGTPAALAYSGSFSSVQIIFTNGTTVSGGQVGDFTLIPFTYGGQIRQVLTPQMLADVEVVSTNEFQIYCYTNAGAFNQTTGLYSSPSGLFSIATIQNVGGDTNHFQLSVNTDGTESDYDYYWSDAGQGWTLSSGRGLRNQSKFWNPTLLIQTNCVTNTAGQVVFSEIKWFENLTNAGYTLSGMIYSNYQTNTWSENLTNIACVITQKVVGPSDARLTNQWFYYDNAATDGTNCGRLKMCISPTGYWQRYQYDTNGFLTNQVSQFLGLGTNATDSQSRAFQYSYGALGGASNTTTTVELLQGVEISRSYLLQWPTVTMLIQCQTPGASWTNTNNLVTTTLYDGSQTYAVAPIVSIQYPDGTMSVYTYGNAVRTNVYKGVQTVTTGNLTGGSTGQSALDLASGLLSSWQTNYPDNLGRPQYVYYLDETFTESHYGCCGIDSTWDRAGTQTSYTYDALKRVLTTTRAGITTSNVYDAMGRILSTVRIGTDGSAIVLGTNSYDTAGRLLHSADALGNITTNAYGFDANGNPTHTIYYPDGSTETDTQYGDGSAYRVTGTAVAGVEYDYGADGNGSYVTETKLDTNGNTTSEWVKTYSDMMGRAYLTVYSDGSSNQSYYNNLGQLWKSVDLDGVATLYLYDTNGNQEFTIIDTYGDGQPHFNGTNSITQTVSDVTADHGTVVNRIRSFVWATENVDASNLVSQTETSADGDQTWDINSLGVTNYSRTGYPGNGTMVQTNIAPDNSMTVAVSQNGLLSAQTNYDGNGNPMGWTTYGYEAHGRQSTVTDARNGTTTSVYNNADQVYQTVTPAPGPGQAPQTNKMYFDQMNRLTGMMLPDGTVTTNLYTTQGWMRQTSGSRTYPAGYTFDAQGRTKTLTTWTNFPSSGAAVTTWNYDGNRGWLNSKKYADNNGPSYTYTAAGKLKTRMWARVVVTTNSYNSAGQLSGIGYPAGTPSVAMVYDRSGDNSVFTQGAITTTRSDNSASQVLSESYSGGPLNGLSVTNGYDSLGRRTNLTALNSGAPLLQCSASFDPASRLLTVSDGTNSATYSYLANSPLVDHITFASNATTVMTTSNSYDYLNRLTAVSSAASGMPVVNYQYQYNAANQRTAVTAVDNTYWVYGYDALGQVTNAVKRWPDNSVVAGQQLGYGFDTIGNRRMTLAGGDQNGANQRLASYAANNLNEYASRTVPGAVDVIGSATNTATVWVDQTPTYRKTNYFWLALPITNTGGPVYQTVTTLAALTNGYGTNAEYGTTNIGHVFLAQTPESYSYDTDGNLLSDGRWSYGWDAENRLTNMTGLSGGPVGSLLKLDFAYDYLGRRIQKIVSTNNGSGWVYSCTNRFVYDGWNVVAILDGGDNVLYSFVWGLDLSGPPQGAGGVGGLLSMRVYGGANAGTYFYCNDGNGNVTALVNAGNGSIGAQYEYGAFGELIRATGPLALNSPFLFSTKYRDSESGFYYYGARYYNPFTGRWLSRDPLGEQTGLNTSTFVDNAPTIAIDGLGFTALWTFSGIENWNSDPDAPNTYGDYVDLAIRKLAKVGQAPATSLRSRAGWGPHYWPGVDPTAICILRPDSESLLNQEAQTMASENVTPGLCGKHILVLLVAPKTHTPPLVPSCCANNVTLDVYWSPYDAVPNQGILGSQGGYQYWTNYGTVYTVNPGSFLFWNHNFSRFFGNPTPLMPNPTPPPNGHGAERLMWNPYVALGHEIPSLNSVIQNAMAPASGYDYLWVCHSQGCNIAMHLLNLDLAPGNN